METSETQGASVPDPYGLAVSYPDSLYGTFFRAQTAADTAVLNSQIFGASNLGKNLVRIRIYNVWSFQRHVVALFPVQYLCDSPVDIYLSLLILLCHLCRV